MLHTALRVWRTLPDCLQSTQATVPSSRHPYPMQHAPSVPVNSPSLLLEKGHWTQPPMKAVSLCAPSTAHMCVSAHKVTSDTALASFPIISWQSACPFGWLVAVLKRKQATAWDLVLTSCLWLANLLAATSCKTGRIEMYV
jgi:hypothetical protein